MSDLLSAQEEKLNIEAFGELPGPRGIIVSSLCGSTNQCFAVICKGDFPFPFQTSDQIDELEVKSRMQAIDFYCKKCRKSMPKNQMTAERKRVANAESAKETRKP